MPPLSWAWPVTWKAPLGLDMTWYFARQQPGIISFHGTVVSQTYGSLLQWRRLPSHQLAPPRTWTSRRPNAHLRSANAGTEGLAHTRYASIGMSASAAASLHMWLVTARSSQLNRPAARQRPSRAAIGRRLEPGTRAPHAHTRLFDTYLHPAAAPCIVFVYLPSCVKWMHLSNHQSEYIYSMHTD